MKEEVREHRLGKTSLVPSPDQLLRSRSRMGPPSPSDDDGYSMLALPTVVMQSEETMRLKYRRKKGWRKWSVRVAYLVGIFLLIDFIDDNWWSTPSIWGSDVTLPVSVKRDYSNVNSIEDLSSEFVDPWCFAGRLSCTCKDPMVASGRMEYKPWAHAHALNVEKSQAKDNDVDVLFLGDSITEFWTGSSYGHKHPKARHLPPVFQSLFDVSHGAPYQGLALGISGDTAPELLWRIQNGELPDHFNPPVIWILVGTNDFGKNWCATELVVIGIIRLVEELRLRKPGSTIVINSLLPRTFDRHGYVSKGRPGRWWSRASRSALPSLWDDIEAVNEELRNYATSRSKVEYVDTTRMFFVDPSEEEEHLRIDTKLMPDYLHPSEKGYREWGQTIQARLNDLIPR